MTWNIDERKRRLRKLFPLLGDEEISRMAASPVLQDGEAVRVGMLMLDGAYRSSTYLKDGPTMATITDSLPLIPDEFRHKVMHLDGLLASGSPLVLEDAARQADALGARMRTVAAGGQFMGMTNDDGSNAALVKVAEYVEGAAAGARAVAEQHRARGAR